ncbi:murein biosynthesis integral membrane protein MurJ [Nocardia ninae]|uniref:Putative peptidoglycan biosynthesis protein MviN n=2 Tax=Nocardia ninae TaxID=356145 RepID=A0A511MIH5_9NOCA|nr:putative peptidoglycan biosynthesis protein MviN [Nocardia ninae NBRC 108245]
MSDPKLLVLGIGVTFGVIVQALSLLLATRRSNIDLRPLWGIDPRIKQFGGMCAAIIVYVFISQVGLIFAMRISSHADAAGPAIYQTTWLVLQLPYGVLGVTLLTALMPRLSRNAAEGDTPAVVDDLGAATRLTMMALVPVVVFLSIAGPQVGMALYGYGNFGTSDAGRLGEAISWSAFTLIPYSLVLIHLRVFYAREQAWTPTWIILGITIVRVIFTAIAPLIVPDDHVAIALGAATGLGYIAGAVTGGWLLHRSLGDLRMVNVGRTVTRVVLASVAGAAVTLIMEQVLGLSRLHSGSGSLFRVIIDAVVMFGVAFGLMRIVRIPEIVAITVAISRRLGLTPPSPDLGMGGTVGEVHETMVLPRPEHVDPYYYRYEPYMDAQTMVLPVIRPDRSGRHPVVGHAGTGLTPDAGTPSKAVPPIGMTPSPPRHFEPQTIQPQDTTYDTGMLPVGSPEMPPMRVEPAARRAPRGPQLIPGASVADGRYRLLASYGGARGLRFWKALDMKLGREVALTFVDADRRAADNAGQDGPQAILSRTLRLGRINSSGLARVLDVVRGSSGGIVVAEWTPGRTLREMAETRPSAIGAARAVRALAAAADLAHRGGGSLSIDHPDRIRISASGDAVLAFPGTLADSDAQSDVRGIGATLYALLTARWPIPSGDLRGTAATVGGLQLADFAPDGIPVEPRQIRPETPFEISAVAVRSLESNKDIRTAATVRDLLEQASVVDQKTEFIPVLRLGPRAQPAADESLADLDLLAVEKERSRRRMWILVGVGLLAALVVGVILWWLLSVFAPRSSSAPLNEHSKLGLTSTAAGSPSPDHSSRSATPSAPGGGVPASVTSVSVFSPGGTPDDPGHVSAVMDDNPATIWRSDQYFQQFPALKKGVGILATLGSPSKLTKVSLDSATPDTVVEIRTSPTATPTLDQTQLIGRSMLRSGTTEIVVVADKPSRYVLIWITALANTGGQFQSSIGELHFEATP